MNRSRWGHRAARVVALLLVALTAAPGVAGGATSPRPIMFGAAPTGQSSTENVFAMNPGGKGLRRLTSDGRSTNPVLSPDGRWIAYAKRYDAGGARIQWDLMLMRADGSGKRRLTRSGQAFEYPTSWSPDGSKIVISRLHERDDSRNGVFVVRRDGSGLRRLLGPRYRSADWSPVSRRLVAVYKTSARTGMRQIATIGVDGTGRRLLTGTRYASDEPKWSPDGRQIVFRQERPNTFTVDLIRVVNADGTNQRTLADTAGGDSYPDWSPDGRFVAFWAPGYPSKIDRVNVATGEVVELRTAYARDLSW